MRDPREAEDVVQEAYVRTYVLLEQSAGSPKFSTWLTKIAVREALARLRDRNRTAHIDGANGLTGSIPDPEEQTVEHEGLTILEGR